MSGGLFVGVEKYLIGGITDATKGLMMSYSSMIMEPRLGGMLSSPMVVTRWDIRRM